MNLLNLLSFPLYFLKKSQELFIILANFTIIVMTLNMLGLDTHIFKIINIQDGYYNQNDIIQIFYNLYFVYLIIIFFIEKILKISIKIPSNLLLIILLTINIVGLVFAIINIGPEMIIFFIFVGVGTMIALGLWKFIDYLENLVFIANK